MISRREFVAAALSTGVLASGGCSTGASATRVPEGDDDVIRVAERPAPIAYVPMKRKVATPEQLEPLFRAVVPEHRLSKYPLVYLYHALRLWGKEKEFNGLSFVNPLVEELGWGSSAFDALIDSSTYLKISSASNAPLLMPSEFGVEVLTTADQGWGSEWASSHPGKYEQVMAELDIPTTQKLRLRDGAEYALRDVIIDSARRVNQDIEFEWTTISLARYLESDRWQNRYRQTIDFDLLANWLLAQTYDSGACCGIHILYALATVDQLSQNGHRTLQPEVQDAIRRRLLEITRLLSSTIAADGSWSDLWWNVGSAGQSPHGGPQQLTRILATGHHLEWMSLCDPDLRPREDVLEQAILSLLSAVPAHARFLRSDWFSYLPISHAVRAVCNLQGIQWPPDVELEEAEVARRDGLFSPSPVAQRG